MAYKKYNWLPVDFQFLEILEIQDKIKKGFKELGGFFLQLKLIRPERKGSRQNALISIYQCLGSGSLRFWLPGSGSRSSKICGSTDPDPRGTDQPKTAKNFFTPKTRIWTLEKREILSKSKRNDLDPDPFFSTADPGSKSESASKSNAN